jgi:hypothetical protein
MNRESRQEVKSQKSKVKSAPRGVTLLELAVSVAVGSVIFFILGAIFLAQGQYFAIEDAIAETQVQAFQAADAVGLYTSSARRVVASRTVNGTAYASGDALVILELPSIDASGNVLANVYDYVAVGRDPNAAVLFIVDIERGTGSARQNGKFVRASLVDKVIFRYNTVDITAATALDLYVRTSKNARGRTILTPLGKLYYLASS